MKNAYFTAMAKRIPLSLCLLTSLFVAGVPARAAISVPTASETLLIAQPGIVQTITQLVAQQTATSQAKLTLEDLPSGFAELPPELATVLASRLDDLRQRLGQENLKPENFFAFVNPQTFQMVLGFTGKLPTEPEQSDFDANLQKLQQPETQQQLISQLQESGKAVGGIKVTEYRTLPRVEGLADGATGLTLAMELQGQPFRVDLTTFRRDAVAAFTAVMYADGEQPAIAVGDAARKLDSRIMEPSEG